MKRSCSKWVIRLSMARTVAWSVSAWLLGLGLTVGAAGELTPDEAVKSVTEKELRSHIEFLASDTLEGREAGSDGGHAAAAYIVQELKKYKLKAADDDGDYFQYFNDNCRNIMAVVPGSDEKLKNEHVLICAHYDHVGFGTKLNSRGPTGFVHNGADDNASGTSGVLEVAEALARLKTQPKRSVLIAFWDSEENGLIGSNFFVSQPTIGLKQIKLVLNADMIGRLRPTSFEFYGWRTAIGLRDWATAENSSKLHISFTYEYQADSDHWPFFERGIPSIMLHTGRHDDYHRPSDDVDKINYAGVEQVSRYLLQLTTSAANRDDLPAFRRESASELNTLRSLVNRITKPARPSRLGISYNSELSEQRIVKLTNVKVDGPAAKAGLRVDDEIVSFAGRAIKDFDNFNTLVAVAKSPAKTVIKRDGQEQEVSIDLTGDGVSIGVQWQTDAAEPGRFPVSEVVPASPAEIAGMVIGQRILKAAGKTVTTSDELKKLILEAENPVELVVEENGNIKTLSLKRIE